MESDGDRRVELVLRGRVQGVGFRFATREQARRLGLRGWVRNEIDGSVRLVAAGSGPALDQFVRWCAEGPARARVDEVERRDPPTGGVLPDPFDVRA